MKTLPILAILLTSLALPARAAGSFVDGYQLFQLCQADQRLEQAMTLSQQTRAATEIGRCGGYVEGAIDGLLLARYPAIACLPNIHFGQAEDIVKSFLAGHPELLHHPASELVGMALQEVFRCGRQ